MDDRNTVKTELAEIAAGFMRLKDHADIIETAADLMIESLRAGGKVLFCGNGGSASDSQHLAAELIGRYQRDREPLAAIALTVDTSALTSIGNDYGFEHVYARQVGGLGRAGDVLVAISTSGKSPNVVLAAQKARSMDMRIVAMTGEGESPLSALADATIAVPASRTNRIQEMHIAAGHIICGLVEEALCAGP